jgi:hypothetical protein
MLIEFFGIVPRKMKNVKSHLISATDDLTKTKNNIISEEQATLDVMAGQVKLNSDVVEDTTEDVNHVPVATDIIHASGLDIVEVTDQTIIDKIKSMMADNKGKFKHAFEVINNETKTGGLL